MTDTTSPTPPQPTPPGPRRGPGVRTFVVVLVFATVVTALVAALVTNIFVRKQEAKDPYLKFVNVDNNTTDPAEWGKNWPRQLDSYRRTADATRTRFGGSEAMPEDKLRRDPWLRDMYAGYAFSIDYRERRGHAYMLSDQLHTQRIQQRPQPGACLHCHASIIPTYRRVGAEELGKGQAHGFDFDWPSVMAGFKKLSTLPYTAAFAEVARTEMGATGATATPGTLPAHPTTQAVLAAIPGHDKVHPVSCVDCHDPKNMELRVTRPGFVIGIQALANSEAAVPHLPSIERWRQGSRKAPFDPNVDATRQEMRSFVCGQCHVEYYCGPKETLFFPWANGLRVEQIEKVYDQHVFPDGSPFTDYKHGITGNPRIYKAQHPEFELWSQGTHAQAGVSCSDCHMPYTREGALKVSDHWIRSPMLMANRACQTCHPVPEAQLHARSERIQRTTYAQLQRAGTAVSDMVNAIKVAKSGGATDEQLQKAFDFQRKAQWRLDFVSSENSMGFHAAQESVRILGEAIDFARQGQLAANSLRLAEVTNPTTVPVTPVQGVTPGGRSPAGPTQ
jgi:nitrite reductase (cytochrome c-552)